MIQSLSLYKEEKKDFHCRPYLDKITDSRFRCFSNLRLSSHQLNIETGRYTYTAEKVDIKDVSSPTLPIFHELETTTLTNLQQKAVVTHFHLLHANDEITRIQKEALAFLLYLSSQSQAI